MTGRIMGVQCNALIYEECRRNHGHQLWGQFECPVHPRPKHFLGNDWDDVMPNWHRVDVYSTTVSGVTRHQPPNVTRIHGGRFAPRPVALGEEKRFKMSQDTIAWARECRA